MNAQPETFERDAPEATWRADAPALETEWLENEQRDAALRDWFAERERETVTAACFI